MQKLPENIFVTGVGTGVGKTVVSSVLVNALQFDYWKPVQCGNLDDSDTMIVKSLLLTNEVKVHPEAYRFKTASSPHYAAKIEGVTIEVAKCISPVKAWPRIIEGAGGLMVPLNDKECMIDLISSTKAPVVLVCRNYLGSINHALLSIELLKQRDIPLMGLLFSGDNFLDNEEIIQHFGQVKILGRIEEGTRIDKPFIQQQAISLRQSISKYYSL